MKALAALAARARRMFGRAWPLRPRRRPGEAVRRALRELPRRRPVWRDGAGAACRRTWSGSASRPRSRRSRTAGSRRRCRRSPASSRPRRSASSRSSSMRRRRRRPRGARTRSAPRGSCTRTSRQLPGRAEVRRRSAEPVRSGGGGRSPRHDPRRRSLRAACALREPLCAARRAEVLARRALRLLRLARRLDLQVRPVEPRARGRGPRRPQRAERRGVRRRQVRGGGELPAAHAGDPGRAISGW